MASGLELTDLVEQWMEEAISDIEDGPRREQRNVLLRERENRDYSFVDWLYGPTALFPEDEPPMFEPIPLGSVQAGAHLPRHAPARP